MALDKTSLKNTIRGLLDDLWSDTGRTPEQAREKFATDLSNAIDVFVKTGSPNVPGTGLTAGATAVTGASITGTIT